MITSFTASNPSFALLPWMPLILLIKLVDHCFKHPRKKRLALFSLRCFSAFVVLRFCCDEFRCILSLGWSSCHSHELTVTRGLRSQLGCSLLRGILFLNPFDWCWLDWDRFRLRCAFSSSMLKALPMECRNPHGKWRAQMHVHTIVVQIGVFLFVFIETINAFYSPQDRYKNDSIKHYRCSLDIRSQP